MSKPTPSDLLKQLRAMLLHMTEANHPAAAENIVPCPVGVGLADLVPLERTGDVVPIFDNACRVESVLLIDNPPETPPCVVLVDLPRCPACGCPERSTRRTRRILADDEELIGRRIEATCARCGHDYEIEES